MNRDGINPRLNLALDNILDVVPFIDNTGEADAPLNQALVRLYERNLAALNVGL